jgi:hypothetical protein
MVTVPGHKKMQIKTTLKFHITHFRMAIIKNTTNNKFFGQDVGEKEPLYTVGMNVGSTTLWKTIWSLLKKLNIDLPYDLAISLLGINLKEFYYKSTCTPMFIAALFTIAKLWKQPRCLTTDEWIKKMWYLYTMEFYSATKKNEILSFTRKWMELENIILNKVSQTQKAKNSMFSFICRL